MGLELTELVMACEEEFGVVIAEESVDIAELDTVGGLATIIARQLEHPSARGCPGVRVYFSLRTALAAQHSVEKGTVKGETPLDELFPQQGRREAWRALQRALPYRLPPLKTTISTRAIGWISAGLGIPLGLWLVAKAYVFLGNTAYFLLPVLLYAIPAIVFTLGTYQLSRILPVQTVGELVDAVMGSDTQGLAPGGHAWTEDAIWIRLREMIARRFDVDPDLITPETHFFKDLGFD